MHAKLRMLLSGILMLSLTGCPSGSPDDGNDPWSSKRVDNEPSINPVAVVVFDMDGDDDLDIISAWRGAPIVSTGPEVGLIAIHFQKPFDEWETIVIESGQILIDVNSIAIADINRDDNPDIIAAAMDRIFYFRAPNNPILPNDWFTYTIDESMKTITEAWFDVAAVDLDDDNGLDIVAVNAEEDGRLSFFLSPQNIDSNFGWERVDIETDNLSFADSLALSDLDDDDDLDVIVSAPGEDESQLVWFEQPDDAVDDDWNRHTIGDFEGATRLAVGHVDDDELSDLATISPVQRRVAWFRHPEDLEDPWDGFLVDDFDTSTDGRSPIDVAIADLNGDGENEIIVATANPPSVSYFTRPVLNLPTWRETVIAAPISRVPGLFDVGDIDDDLDPDIAVPLNDFTLNEDDLIVYLINPFED